MNETEIRKLIDTRERNRSIIKAFEAETNSLDDEVRWVAELVKNQRRMWDYYFNGYDIVDDLLMIRYYFEDDNVHEQVSIPVSSLWLTEDEVRYNVAVEMAREEEKRKNKEAQRIKALELAEFKRLSAKFKRLSAKYGNVKHDDAKDCPSES